MYFIDHTTSSKDQHRTVRCSGISSIRVCNTTASILYKKGKQKCEDGNGRYTYFDTICFFVQQALGCCRDKDNNARKSVASWN